jgi:hypothetical protein
MTSRLPGGDADGLRLPEAPIDSLHPSRGLTRGALPQAISLQGRLKKFLSRGLIGLKFVGETPDEQYEARFPRSLLESFLVAATHCGFLPGVRRMPGRGPSASLGRPLRRPWGRRPAASVEASP